MRRKLTTKFLGDETGPSKPAKPAEGDNQVLHTDTVAPGLNVRVGRGGKRSFVVTYRWNNKVRWDTLRPAYPALTLDAARAEARTTTADVAAGRDPRRQDREPRRHYLPEPDAGPRVPQTYRQAVEDYIERVQRRQAENRTADEVRRALLRVGGRRLDRDGNESVAAPHWLDRPLSEITARDVRRQLELIRDGDASNDPAPYSANRTYSYLRTFFAWCLEPGIELVDASPAAGLKKPAVEHGRKRTFTDAELAAIWRAADQVHAYAGAILKLLILTGKRKGAVAAMRWDDIDDYGLWTPPQDNRRKRGNKRTHAIPLPPLARRILSQLPRVEGSEYVFPSAANPAGHLKPHATLQRRVRDLSGIADFSFHAIRHTVETGLASNRIPPHVRDLLLDHAPARGAGAGYDHYEYRDEMAEALATWERHVEQALRANNVWPKSENVTPIG